MERSAYIAQVFVKVFEARNVRPLMIVVNGGINHLIAVPVKKQVPFGNPLGGFGAIHVARGVIHDLRARAPDLSFGRKAQHNQQKTY